MEENVWILKSSYNTYINLPLKYAFGIACALASLQLHCELPEGKGPVLFT